MKRSAVLIGFLSMSSAFAQEASSGIDLRATITGEAVYDNQLTESPRNGAPVAGGFRSMLYPTWKIGKHWVVSGAIDVNSTPYFAGDFSSPGYGVTSHIIQANI